MHHRISTQTWHLNVHQNQVYPFLRILHRLFKELNSLETVAVNHAKNKHQHTEPLLVEKKRKEKATYFAMMC